MKKNFIPVTLVGLLLLGVTAIPTKLIHFHVSAVVRTPFEKFLTVKDTLPSEKVDALYILGGSSLSTAHHVKKAASLFHSGKTDRILIFDSREKWHYEPELGRNTTRNELTIKMLVDRGVPKSCIDTVPVNEGFFGTLSEARALKMYLRSKTFDSVMLLSSPCHSRRVKLSFNHYLKKTGVSMYIVSSEDPFLFSELIMETVKVLVYAALQYLPL